MYYGIKNSDLTKIRAYSFLLITTNYIVDTKLRDYINRENRYEIYKLINNNLRAFSLKCNLFCDK